MPYKEFCVFFSGKLLYKSNRKPFSCVCIAWYKHSRRWENSRRLCKPSTSSRVCITISNSPQPLSCLYQASLNTENVFYCLSFALWCHSAYYFGGARVKDSRRSGMYQSWHFGDKIGHANSVGFRFYSAIWRTESRISSRCLEITSISLIYSLTYSRKKELLFWLSRGLNRLTCVTRQIRGDSKLRD